MSSDCTICGHALDEKGHCPRCTPTHSPAADSDATVAPPATTQPGGDSTLVPPPVATNPAPSVPTRRAPPPERLPPGLESRFELVSVLGRGGMGVVYLVRDRTLGRQVALKLIRAPEPRLRERFEREAVVLANLEDDNIVRLYEVGLDGETPFMLMELVRGETLQQRMQRGRMEAAEAVRCVRDILRALHQAHARGIVHRDIKPANVFVTHTGRVKVADFGLAREELLPDDHHLTRSGAIIGTPGYMAPEQTEGERVTAAADVWAAGVILHELLTGRRLFTGKDVKELLLAPRRRVPRPSSLEPSIGPELDGFVESALAQNPADRPSSADLAESMHQWLRNSSSPTSAPMPRYLRVYLSFPGDVGCERELARRIVDRLIAEFGRRLRIELAARVTECDVAVMALWSRLDAIESGHEFEEARESFRQKGMPEVLVFRRTDEPRIPLKPPERHAERVAELAAVDDFLRRHGLAAGADTPPVSLVAYPSLFEFEEAFEQHLRRVITARATLFDSDLPAPVLTWATGSPFRGLRAFDFEHAPIFAGRTHAIDAVLGRLQEKAQDGCPFLLILGASGSGKSSLLRAGVLPLIVEPGVIEGVGGWRRAVMMPSEGEGSLLAGLAAALVRPGALPELTHDGTTLAELTKILESTGDGLPLLIKGALSQVGHDLRTSQGLATQPQVRLVLALDQLEEAFTLGDRFTDEGRAAFFRVVAGLVRSGYVWVVATLRSDFFHWCETAPELMELKEEGGLYHLMPPTVSELARMLRIPARAAGLTYERNETGGLDEMLATACAREPGSLPLLSFTLDELYHRREDTTLTLKAYREMGGLDGALGRRAEEAFVQYADAACCGDQALAAQGLANVFRQLVTVGADPAEPFTRRVADLTTLENRDLVDRLVAGRLLTTGGEGRRAIVQVAHESLLLRWERLSALLQSDRAHLRVRAEVEAEARRWEREGRPPDLLVAEGRKLVEARELLARSRELEPLLLEFVIARTADADRREEIKRQRDRRDVQRTRAVAGMLALLVCVMAGLAAAAFRAQTQAEIGRRQADIRYRVAQAIQGAPLRPVEAAIDMLTAAAKRTNETELAELSGPCITMQGYMAPPAVFHGHDAAIQALACSPDGRLIATGAADHAIRLWKPDGTPFGKLLEGHGEPIAALAFSPDSKRLASASRDGTVRVWTVDDSASPLTVKGHTAAVTAVAFAPKGELLATGSEDQTVRLWNARGEPHGKPLSGHERAVRSVAFAPDGTLASGSDDRTIRLWNLDGAVGQPIGPHGDRVLSVAFNHDGTLIASGAADHRMRIWKRSGQLQGQVGLDHTAIVEAVAWSPDGTLLASASADRSVRLWGTHGEPRGLPMKHDAPVTTLAFSPDGRTLVSGSADRSVRTWQMSWEEVLKLLATKLVHDPAFAATDNPLLEDVRAFATALALPREIAKARGLTPAPPPATPASVEANSKGSPHADMVLIPAGDFLMGGDLEDEKPQRRVWVDAFYIDRYAVTNARYRAFVAATGYHRPPHWHDPRFNGDDQPVVGVTWDDAKAYCDWAGRRLPTEAEREKAARGGLEGKEFPWGNESAVGRACHGLDPSTAAPQRVGCFAPNGFGLYDMAGNCFEWCADWYGADYYQSAPDRNPTGPESGTMKVVRGGAWSYVSPQARCAKRSNNLKEGDDDGLGFRCALSATAR